MHFLSEDKIMKTERIHLHRLLSAFQSPKYLHVSGMLYMQSRCKKKLRHFKINLQKCSYLETTCWLHDQQAPNIYLQLNAISAQFMSLNIVTKLVSRVPCTGYKQQASDRSLKLIMSSTLYHALKHPPWTPNTNIQRIVAKCR